MQPSSLIPEHFYYPPQNPLPISGHSLLLLSSGSWQLLTYLLSLWICLFQIFLDIKGIIQYVAFVSGFFHFTYCFQCHPLYSVFWDFISFHDWVTCQCKDIPHSTYPFVRWWTFGLLPFWGLSEIMLLYMFACKFLYTYMFTFLLGIYQSV